MTAKFRIVADGFRFTNEIRFDAAEQCLYVVETTGGCVSRLRVDDKGNLVNREIFGPASLGKGAWPDGIAFDSFGNLWGTMVYSDKLFVLTPEGDLQDSVGRRRSRRKWTRWSRQFFDNHVTEDVLFATGQGIAPWMASVTFGGPRPANRLYRLAERQAHPLLPRAGRGAADGALEREVIDGRSAKAGGAEETL